MIAGGARSPHPRGVRARWVLALARALPLYWLVVFPAAQRELRRWHARAAAIPDPCLRAYALAKLRSERVVVEGAAAFAILARGRHRSTVIRACVAYEVIYDFVDVLGEIPVENVLSHNRTVHRALSAAVAPSAPLEDYCAHLPVTDESGYLHELIGACREAVTQLPSHAAVLSSMAYLSELAIEAQSLNHAGTQDAHRELVEWAQLRPLPDAGWWELAAAASSPLGVFALLAAASEEGTTVDQAKTIVDAYFPWIGGIVWLMESLVDHEVDAMSGNHGYVAHYKSATAAAERLARIARLATDAAQTLPRGARHVLLLAGAVSVYLSNDEASAGEMRVAADRVRTAIGGPVGPLIAVLRLRRGARRSASSGACGEPAPDH
jgi:tetraprenyl-beta-curcumene synthase